MPLHLVCPCGHSAPLPIVLNSGAMTCGKCKSRLDLRCFDGFDPMKEWMLRDRGGVPSPEARIRIEYQSQGER